MYKFIKLNMIKNFQEKNDSLEKLLSEEEIKAMALERSLNYAKEDLQDIRLYFKTALYTIKPC